ncbi:DNA sulfur modification protein DndB [Methylibium sp.]|uniref:DNA sulfur modification protein DndB n=1 Tax=Methylibium sp. TaxID=2067992 RepID=UPI003D0E7B80
MKKKVSHVVAPLVSEDSHELSKVAGMLVEPKRTASGGIYRGRFSCPEVQWIGSPPEIFGTFTITAEQLTDAAENGLLWTDQDVQRGVKPGLPGSPPKELSLSVGYPDPNIYVFDTEKADAITEKLLRGDKVFLNSLVWNLRPGRFEAHWNKSDRELFLYTGKIYLPDSHHRHQAIIKAVRAWRESPKDYPKFSGAHQFKVELYFLSREDEGNYFYDKNQLPKPTAKSKAFDLTTVDALSLLAKKVIGKSINLDRNVNRVTDRLTPKNPQVVTLSTLREMMKAFAPNEDLDDVELEGLATVAAQFYDLLCKFRPELGVLEAAERKVVRQNLLVDSAVMMHGYAALMKDFNDDLPILGMTKAISTWNSKLSRLRAEVVYRGRGGWSGDLFDKRNPLWSQLGIVKEGRDGQKVTVLNTGAARIECGRALRKLLAAPVKPNIDLGFLALG